MQSNATAMSIVQSCLKKAFATLGQKALHGQLNKIIPSGMCNLILR